MKENNIDMWFGGKNILQNNSAVFEMRTQGWRGLLAVAFILLVFGFIAFNTMSEEPEFFEKLKSEQAREMLFQQTSEFIAEIPKEAYIAVAIGVLIIIFAIFIGFTRVAYIRIDNTQMIVGNALDHRLGRPGDQYIIASPAKLTGKIRGSGKNRRLELTLTTTGGEVKKIKLYGQAFGNRSLKALVEWLSKYRPNG